MRGAMIFAAFISTAATSASLPQSTPNPLIGTWRLVSYVDTPANGAPIYAFGKHPIGQFMFSADGRASVNIMRNPPNLGAPTADIDPDSCLPEWYCSYFGTYRLDGDRRGWTIRVLGGNIASFIGTDQHRAFRIENRRIIISEIYVAADRKVRAERILEKIVR